MEHRGDSPLPLDPSRAGRPAGVRRRARRGGPAGVLAALAVSVLAGCSAVGPVGRAPAAVVGDVEITQERVLELVEADRAFTEAAGLAQELDEATIREALSRFVGPGADTVAASATADKLSLLIGLEIFRAVAEREQVEVTESHLASAAGQLTQELSGQGLSRSSITEELFEVHQERLALQQALSEAAPEVPLPTDDELRELFEAQVGDFTQLCMHSIVVAAADGEAAVERLEGGEDLVAVVEDLGGQPPAEQAECVAVADVAAVAPEATEATEGSVLGPLETQEGSWILVVEDIDVPTFEDIRAQLLAPFQQEAEQSGRAHVSQLIIAALEAVEVRVDPRFGTWNPDTGLVDPPTDPAERGLPIDMTQLAVTGP